MGAGRFAALLEPATVLLLQPWSLNLLSESLGRVQKYGFVGLAPDLMNQEGRIYIKNNPSSRRPTYMFGQDWDPLISPPSQALMRGCNEACSTEKSSRPEFSRLYSTHRYATMGMALTRGQIACLLHMLVRRISEMKQL